MAGASSNPPRSRSSPPDLSSKAVAFDTASGDSRPLSSTDKVVRRSKEESFYIMQQLCIAGESVLSPGRR
jgi:hypothetical protein